MRLAAGRKLRTITRHAVLHAAAQFAFARPSLKSRDGWKILVSWERWINREPSDPTSSRKFPREYLMTRLTPDERLVLRLAADGLSTCQIANRADMMVIEVQDHLEGAITTLGALEAIIIALRRGEICAPIPTVAELRGTTTPANRRNDDCRPDHRRTDPWSAA
jgi:hypothetical protein